MPRSRRQSNSSMTTTPPSPTSPHPDLIIIPSRAPMLNRRDRLRGFMEPAPPDYSNELRTLLREQQHNDLVDRLINIDRLTNLENDMNSTYSTDDDNDEDEDEDEQYGINLSIPYSYERKEIYNIEPLSNKILDTHSGKIKIKNTQTVYDYIDSQDTNIKNYITNDVDNIVFVYENTYYISSKTMLKKYIDMTTTDNSIVFDCRGTDYTNVNFDYPYFLINVLGINLSDFTNLISLENAIAITKPYSGQYFIIKGTDEVLISTVTDNVLNGKYPNAVSGSHCQPGKSAIVYDIQKFEPTYTNERKSPKTKKRKSKSPKRVNTRKRKV
jgi:hypothetical protein